MNDFQKRVMKTEYKENCYVLISCQWKSKEKPFDELNLSPTVSFLYDSGNVSAEWNPSAYGPIQIWHKAESLHENTREHYFYDFVYNKPLAWSQLAVNTHYLPKSFVSGDYDWIFSVLESWAIDR